jgi:hypothetical protein
MKQFVPILICVLPLLLETAHAESFESIERAISQKLADPKSAEFRQLRRSHVAPQVYCGRVNSKNKSGEYAGERLFLYDSQLDNLTLLENPLLFQYDLDTRQRLDEVDRAEAGIKSYIALCVQPGRGF